MGRCVILVVIGLLAPGMGCMAPRPVRSVSNPNPSGKIPAIKEAARQRDIDAAPQLVKDLDSDDPAVRFYAITGLRKITGQAFGYRYYDDERDRRPALKRWQQWLADQARSEMTGGGQQEARPDDGGASDAPDHASGP